MDVLQKPVPQTPAGPVKLAVGVEESRAQRHQRQQNRFRDRGGIFKPSNRNTLVDILMGRRAISPRKSIRRSASCSPSKRDKTPSRRKNNADAANTSKKGRTSQNDHVVSPKKLPSKLQAPAVPKGSNSEETREEPNTEASSGSTLRKTRTVAKQRKRSPKQQDPTGAVDVREKTTKPRPKRKPSKSQQATRKKQTKSEKTSAGKFDVPSSVETEFGLSTIPEEAEQCNRSDVDDERPKKTNRDGGKRRNTEKRHAGAFKGTRVASNGNEDAATLGKGDKVVASTILPMRKGKTLPSGFEKDSLDHSDMDKPVKRRRLRTRGAKASEQAEMDDTDAGTNEKTAEVKPSSWKESEPPNPSTSSTHSKRQMPDPSDDDAETENLGRDAKRVRPRTTGKQKHDKLSVANTLVPTCRQPISITQVANTSSHDGSIKRGPSAMMEVKPKKRARNPEDSSAANLSPSKRVKISKADPNPGKGRTMDQIVVDDKKALITKTTSKPSIPSRKLKENTVTSTSPLKRTVKISKSKTTSKRNKGLPRRVLQRLKNSEPHLVDDEPDPIDFLS